MIASPSRTPSKLVFDITNEVHDVSARAVKYGGWSDIYTGTWYCVEGKKKVALKVYRSLDPFDSKSQKRVQREISVWKRLSHPNVQDMCGLYYGLGPLPALVSPWSNAGDINDYLSKHRSNPNLEAMKLKLMSQVAEGLLYLHDHSVVHGDIKGGNVLISDGGAARLSDFGLSNLLVRSSQSFTQDSVVKGTSRWMAPELFTEEEPRLTYTSDMWAFGCLLVEVQTGKMPYYNKANDQQVIIALSKHELPARSPDIPDTLWSIVLDCCTIDPHQRPEIALIGRCLNRYRVMSRLSYLLAVDPSKDSQEPAALLLGAIREALSLCYAQDLCTFHLLCDLSDADLVTQSLHRVVVWSHLLDRNLLQYSEELLRACLASIPPRLQSLKVAVAQSRSLRPATFTPAALRPLARLLSIVHVESAIKLMTILGDPCVSVARWPRIGLGAETTHATWFPCRTRIATVCYTPTASAVRVIYLPTMDDLLNIAEPLTPVDCVAVCPAGRLVAFCSRTVIQLWDTESGRCDGKYQSTSDIRTIAFSFDSTRIVCGSHSGTIRVYGIGPPISIIATLRGHSGPVLCLSYSRDGSRIISSASDCTIRVWNVVTGTCILGPLRGHAGQVRAVAISPDDSYLASASDDCTVRIWDPHTGDMIGSPLTGHTTAVRCITCTRDGNRIASGAQDGTIFIWDVSGPVVTGRQLTGHRRAVLSLLFSLGGHHLASSSSDGTARIWDGTEKWMRWDV